MIGHTGFDDMLSSLPVGIPFSGRGRTITAAEMNLLAAVSHWADDAGTVGRAMDDDPDTHLEPHLVLAVVLSLAAAGPLFARLEVKHRLTVVAALRHSAVLHATVPAGCTLTTRSTLVAYRKSASAAGRLIVTVRDEAHDALGKAVMTIDRVVLMHHTPPDNDGAAR